MFSVTRRVNAAFALAAFGEYRPGAPLDLRAAAPPDMTRLFLFHEDVHAALTEETSIGRAAILCGLIDLYSEDAGGADRRAAREFLRSVVNRCCWIHEGVATACMIVECQTAKRLGIFLDKEISLAPSYAHAAAEAMTKAVPLAQVLAERFSTSIDSALHAVLLGLGIAAMSPPMSHAQFGEAVRNHPNAATILRTVWPRHKRIHVAPMSSLVAALNGPQSPPENVGVRSWAQWIARVLCEATCLPMSSPIATSELIRQHVPQLSKFVENEFATARKPVLADIGGYETAPVYRPLNAGGEEVGPERLFQALRDHQGFAVVEAGADRHGPLLLVHFFANDCPNPVGMMVKSPDLSPAACQEVWALAKARQSAQIGILTAYDIYSKDRLLRAFLSGIPRLFVKNIGYSLLDLRQRRPIGCTGDVVLFECHDIDGIRFIELGPPTVRTTPLPHPWQYYAAAVRNGLNAHLRWVNHHRDLEEEFKWSIRSTEH